MPSGWRSLRAAANRLLARIGRAEDHPSLPTFMVRYDQVFESLSRADLGMPATRMEEEDVFAELFAESKGSDQFLSLYSKQGARLALERYGFLDLLRKKGIDPVLAGDLSNADQHRFCIYDGAKEPERLVIELVVGFEELVLPDGSSGRMLLINWLLMQNPNAEFPPDRPRLPDQDHPGLGLFIYFGYLLRLMALRLDCDGLLNHPSHFHNAALYGKFFHFADPRVEGRFLALQRDLDRLSLAEATHAVDRGRVVDAQGEVAAWEPAPQVMPIRDEVRGWFESASYRREVDRVRRMMKFRVRSESVS